MRFCQTDGTPLVDDAPVDPYKTMVASSGEIAAAMGSPAGSPSDTEGSVKVDDEVLQLPANDPKKTMFASEEEIRKEMQAHDEPVMDLPPLSPDPSRSVGPSSNPPSFGDKAPSARPPSPYAPSANDPIANPSGDDRFSKTTPPIPSPFDNPKPSTYGSPAEYKPASEPEPYRPAEPVPFEPMGGPIESARPAAAPSWQASEPMQNSPMSSAAAGQNKTLAIVSLVAGILGLTVCCGSILPSIVALVLGFMAKNKAANDPSAFGGSGLAMGGIITGVLGLIGTIALWIFVFFFNGMALLMQSGR